MDSRSAALPRWVLGPSLIVTCLALSSCGHVKGMGFPVTGDHMVYVTKTAALVDVTVHTTGNPKGTGDQVAWTAVDGTPITGITIPDPSVPGTGCQAPTWNPFPHPENGPTKYGYLSGALDTTVLPANGSPWCVPYSVRLQGVLLPIYGHIMIVRP